MDADRLHATLPSLVADAWGLVDVRVSPLGGGMNSETARVDTLSGSWVAKWVRAGGVDDLLRGAETARRLTLAGLSVGAPLPTSSGRYDVPLDGGALVLLEHVPGVPLTGENDAEQVLIGELLGRAHTSGTPPSPRRAPFFEWMRPGLAAAVQHPRLAGQDWIGPEVSAALASYDGLPAVTWGTLHTDPAPEAFLLDASSGRLGLVDWAGSLDGPLLYDVASAVMYLGGPDEARPFLASYVANGPLGRDELDTHLEVFRRFRWAVQAVYFAGRLAEGDLTGIDDESGNRKGLADARCALVTPPR